MRFLGRELMAFPVELLLAFLVCLSFATVDSDDGESFDLTCFLLVGR